MILKNRFLMLSILFVLTASMLPAGNQSAGSEQRQIRPVHTYSIVARDPATGDMGVAVQSHWFSVGTLVTWAEAGVGAVATQSFVEVSYGPEGLRLMKAGKSAPEALKELLAKDPQQAVRQVAMVDSKGNVAVHTGDKCIAEAGHVKGNGFSTQANMMLKDTVWIAMAEAYRNTSGELADRLIAALEAAEKEGGDIRGRQSAAILIVKARSSGKPWDDKVIDLRVEDHPDPVGELKRLVKVARAYNRMNSGDAYLAANDVDRAMTEYEAAEKMLPDNIELVFWHALTLVGLNEIEKSLPLFEKVFAVDKNWLTLLKRLPKAGLLKEDPELIKKLESLCKNHQ